LSLDVEDGWFWVFSEIKEAVGIGHVAAEVEFGLHLENSRVRWEFPEVPFSFF
jgi:hypothetical protein